MEIIPGSLEFSFTSLSIDQKSVQTLRTLEADSETKTSKSAYALQDSIDRIEQNIAKSVLDRLKQIKSEMEQALLQMGGAQENSDTSIQGSVQIYTVDLDIVATDSVVRKEINIDISALSLNFSLSKEMSPRQKLLDPLVVDFAGSGVELSDEKFDFDLDSDGKKDQISMLKKGSGFLALDRNGNGKIDEGSELFGTKSGDGFADLSQYDDNKDNKIDSSDSIYDKLRIWRKNDSGEDKLIALGEAGIGVIYLNALKNQTMLYDSSGSLAGIAQKSAAVDFLNGTASDIYHIDLVAG